MEKTKVFIVDDHPIILDAVILLLRQSEDFEIAGTAYNVDSAMQQMEMNVPDIAIIDIGLPGKSGIDLLKEMKRRLRQVKPIMFSMHDELVFAPRALRAGARGYVMKTESMQMLLSAVLEVNDGKVFVSNNVKELIFNHFAGHDNEVDVLFATSKFTQQEENVFRLIGIGNSIAQIAEKLSISPKTVQSHKDNIKQKLKVKSSNELYRHAFLFVENGVVSGPRQSKNSEIKE